MGANKSTPRNLFLGQLSGTSPLQALPGTTKTLNSFLSLICVSGLCTAAWAQPFPQRVMLMESKKHDEAAKISVLFWLIKNVKNRLLTSPLNITTSLRHTGQAQRWSEAQAVRFPWGSQSCLGCSLHTVHNQIRQYMFCEYHYAQSFLVKKTQGPDCYWTDHPTDDSPGNSTRPSHGDTSKCLFAFSELVLLSMKTERSNHDLQAETFVSEKRFHLPFYFQAVFNEGT